MYKYHIIDATCREAVKEAGQANVGGFVYAISANAKPIHSQRQQCYKGKRAKEREMGRVREGERGAETEFCNFQYVLDVPFPCFGIG